MGYFILPVTFLTACLKSLDPFYKVSYYSNLVKISWTNSINNMTVSSPA